MTTAGMSREMARLRRSSAIGLASILMLAGMVLLPSASGAQTAHKWQGSLDALGRAGSDDGGQLDLFAPLYQNNDTLLFGNAIGGLDSDSSSGANFGGGIRHIVDGSYILGAYGYFDWLHSPNANTFYQVSGGVEAMTADWDFRLNGYLPISNSADLVNIPKIDGVEGMLSDPVLAIQGNEIGLLREGTPGMPGRNGLLIQETPLGGLEGEVGYRLPFGNALGSNTETRVFLGGYAFWGDGYPTYAGPRGRVEFRVYDLPFLGDGSRLTAGGELSWDDPRGVTGEGSLRLRIPLNIFSGGSHPQLSDLDRRMTDPVPIRVLPIYAQREEIQIANPGGISLPTFEAVEDSETGREISSIYFASAGGTSANSGQQGSATDLADAISRAGMNGLIVATGSSGSYTGHFGLFEGQILLGGASSLDVKGVTTGAMATYTPGLTRPTIIHDGTLNAGAVFVSGVDHGKIQGVDITVNNQAANPGFFAQFSGVQLLNSSDDIVRDVKVTGGDASFVVDAETRATSGDLFNNISGSGARSGFVMIGGSTAAKLSGLKVDGASFDSIVGAGGSAGFGFQSRVAGGQTIDNTELDNITLTNTRWGGEFMRMNGLTIDGWTATGTNDNLPDNTAIAVQTGSNFTLRDFSVSGYLSGISVLDNGTNNLIDGTTRGIIKDIGTQTTSAQGSYGISISNSAVTVQNVGISGIGSTASVADFDVIISRGADVKLSHVDIDGKNTGGMAVTEAAILLSGNGAADSVILESGSDNNTEINVPQLCRNVLTGGATATGMITFTNPAAGTCP